MTDFRKYNFTFEIYNRSIDAQRVERCNGFTATNIGAVICRVNGKLLFPSATPATALGDSRSWGGNKDEIYMGNIEVRFAAGAGALVEIEQKFYVDKE